MTEKKPKIKLAYLSDVLYVPTEHVRQEHLNAYTYKFEKAVYEQPDEVVRKCGNCKYWRVPWMNHNGEEVLCHLKGYTEKDYCPKFFPKPVKRIEEHEVITYNQPNNEFYTFGRGDLGKVERVFHDFQFVDQRSAPKLGINLKMKEGRTLYPDQVKIVEDWLRHGYGILKAPVGAGKCCHGDTLISTNKGLIPIKDIVDPILDVSKNSYEGFEFSDISNLNLRATAFGQDAQISAVCRKKSKTLKITTNWGYSIEVTPEHPLLSISKGKEVWIEAKDLKVADKVAIRVINLNGEPSDFDNRWEHSYIANITHVPLRLLKAGKSKIRDFLREYFTIQGEVLIEGTITCKSEYKRVIQEIQILLLGFNIPSTITQKEESIWSLQIFKTLNNKFQLEIGFNPGSKLAKEIEVYIKDSTGELDNKSVWYPSIKTIEPGEEQWVYDITVPDGHWYVANGIVSHNTVMWAYLVQHIGLKSLLLAQEVRHLQVGFEGLYEHTNIAELEKEAGVNLCGRLGYEHYFDSTGKAVFKKSKDIGKTYPITFSTFQALNSKNGKELMNKGMKDEFGLVWLEECLTGDTLIPTSIGIRRLDELVGNRYIYDQKLNLVVGSRYGEADTEYWMCRGVQPTLKVTTKQGYSYTGTYNHKMLVLDPETYELLWVKTENLKVGQLLCISPDTVERKGFLQLEIPESDAIATPTKMTPQLAFILAAISAKGSLTETGFTVRNTNPLLTKKLNKCVKKCFNLEGTNTEDTITYNYTTILKDWFDYLGLGEEEVIPWSILQADKKSQLAFLAALVEYKEVSIENNIAIPYENKNNLRVLQILLNYLGFHSASLCGNKIKLSYSESKLFYNEVKSSLTSNKLKHSEFSLPIYSEYTLPSEGISKLLRNNNITEFDDLIEDLPYNLINEDRYQEIFTVVYSLNRRMLKNLVDLIELKYRFTEVSDIQESEDQLVYDLVMKDPDNRSFIANGLISSNCHHESAETFHNVVKSFNSYYKGGQSATPTRKDQLHCATYDTIGPVTAVGTKEQMTCQYTFISTGVTAPDRLFFGQYPLPKLFTFISMNKEIQECIFQWLLYDIQSGRKPLYITERKADAFSLRDKIHMSGYNVELIMGGSEAKKQSEYSDRLQDGSLHAIIGTKVIKENYNIPPLDTLHLAYPNFGVESEEQMTGRIRRYVLGSDGKPIFKNQPLIRVYTVGANNTIPKKALEFRRAFYRKMNFEEYQLDATNSEVIENERETLTKRLTE